MEPTRHGTDTLFSRACMIQPLRLRPAAAARATLVKVRTKADVELPGELVSEADLPGRNRCTIDGQLAPDPFDVGRFEGCRRRRRCFGRGIPRGGEEERREEHRAFIPVANGALRRGYGGIRMVGLMQGHVQLDQDTARGVPSTASWPSGNPCAIRLCPGSGSSWPCPSPPWSIGNRGWYKLTVAVTNRELYGGGGDRAVPQAVGKSEQVSRARLQSIVTQPARQPRALSFSASKQPQTVLKHRQHPPALDPRPTHDPRLTPPWLSTLYRCPQMPPPHVLVGGFQQYFRVAFVGRL